MIRERKSYTTHVGKCATHVLRKNIAAKEPIGVSEII